MKALTKPAKKSRKHVTAKAPVPKPLDDKTSALVLAEYLVIEEVAEREIDTILKVSRGLSIREIALTFRITDALGGPDAFKMTPRFQSMFAVVRAAANRGKVTA